MEMTGLKIVIFWETIYQMWLYRQKCAVENAQKHLDVHIILGHHIMEELAGWRWVKLQRAMQSLPLGMSVVSAMVLAARSIGLESGHSLVISMEEILAVHKSLEINALIHVKKLLVALILLGKS
jgi:hypothetical protein